MAWMVDAAVTVLVAPAGLLVAVLVGRRIIDSLS